MSTADIIITPHALTWWNIQKKRQGHIDTPLSDVGHQMAALLADRLHSEPISHIYSSDLKRAMDTAAPVAVRKQLSVSTDPRLREGRWSDTDDPDGHELLPWHQPSESRQDVLDRMIEAMDEIGKKHVGEAVLVISHGAAIKWFVKHVLAIPKEDNNTYRTTRAGLNRLHYKSGNWTASVLNDAAHLSDISHPSLNANSG